MSKIYLWNKKCKKRRKKATKCMERSDLSQVSQHTCEAKGLLHALWSPKGDGLERIKGIFLKKQNAPLLGRMCWAEPWAEFLPNWETSSKIYKLEASVVSKVLDAPLSKAGWAIPRLTTARSAQLDPLKSWTTQLQIRERTGCNLRTVLRALLSDTDIFKR